MILVAAHLEDGQVVGIHPGRRGPPRVRRGAEEGRDVRYAFEDIPTGLVPIASPGALLGVATPACRALVDLACCLYGRDFWAEGRSVENLGLAGLTREELREFVETGRGPGGK